MHLTEQQMTEAQLTEAQQRLRAEQRLREMKDNPWSEFNAHHCVIAGAGETGKSTFIKQMEMIHNKKYNQDNERKPFVPCIREAICRQMLQLASKVRAKLDPLSCAKKRESVAKLVSSSSYPFLGIPVDQGTSPHVS